jgi:hypothetical protein
MSQEDGAIEREIVSKGLTAPRITPDDLKANIAGEYYFTAAEGVTSYHPATGLLIEALRATSEGLAILAEWDKARAKIDAQTPPELKLLTFCVLVLRNGFTVTGESACASPENFNAEIGRKIARQNAVQKIWPLMGYALKQQLHEGGAA